MEMEKDKKTLFNKIILIFFIGSVFGAYYEEILYVIQVFLSKGVFSWVPRRGFLYGPISPVYGLAAVLIFLVFCLKKRKWYQNYIYGCLLGGTYEFGMSLLQEKVFGTVSWDYSNKFLNIGGRTTFPFMLFWGLLIMAFIYLLYPQIEKLYNKMSKTSATKLANFLFIFLSFDALISFVAVERQANRQKGLEPKTFIGELCDRYYNDDYLNHYYNASRYVKK